MTSSSLTLFMLPGTTLPLLVLSCSAAVFCTEIQSKPILKADRIGGR